MNTFCRYNEDTATIQRSVEDGEKMSDEITQHTLLPEVKEEIAHSFSNGDMVEVIEGEMQILQGKVTDNSQFLIVFNCFLGDCHGWCNDHHH